MKNTKEIKAILTAMAFLAIVKRDKAMKCITEYAMRRIFGANTNLLILGSVGRTEEQAEQETLEFLDTTTEFRKYMEEYYNAYTFNE